MTEEDRSTKGELEPVAFGERIIAVKRRCSCRGDVRIKPNPAGAYAATCQGCGATLTFGG
jgi:hypothetical protein